MKQPKGQIHLTIGLGSGEEGVKLKESWDEGAKRLGYSEGRIAGTAKMVREMVCWILAKGIWERGKGLIDLKPSEEEAP